MSIEADPISPSGSRESHLPLPERTGPGKVRNYFYELLHTPEVETKTEYFVRIAIGSIICLSTLSVILESEPELQESYSTYFYGFEVFTIIVFSIEYVFRIWSIVEHPDYSHPIIGRLRYAVTPLALIDLFAIVPFYLPAIFAIDLRFIRILRLIRLVRVLKLGHYSRSLSLIGRVLRSKRSELAAAIFLVAILLVLASTIEYDVEHDAQPKVFRSIPSTLWWGVATLTTVGYGDIFPITPLGKFVASCISILGIGVFALPSGIFVAGFVEHMQLEKGGQLCERCKQEIKQQQTT